MLTLNDLLSTPKLTGRKLYHYTTQDGLLGIAKSRSLWTTSILHLNDSTEFNYAVSLVRRKLESKAQTASKGGRYESFYREALHDLSILKLFTVFVGSFSEEGDSLGQWRAYTHNGIGFSLGFHDTDLESLASKQAYRLVKCFYEENEHDEIISRLIEKSESLVDSKEGAANNQFLADLVEIAPLVKNSAFRDEKEWRVFSPLFTFLGGDAQSRAGKSMLIPYQEFKLELENQPLRMAEIYLGPTPHVELAQASLALLATSKKIMHPVVIQASQVPYRAW